MNRNQLTDLILNLDVMPRPLYPSQAQDVAKLLTPHTVEEVIEEADRGYYALIEHHEREYQNSPDYEEVVRGIVRHLVQKGIIHVREDEARQGLEVAEAGQ